MALPPENRKGAKRRQDSDYNRKFARENALARAIKVDLVQGITTFKNNVDPQTLVRAIQNKKFHLISGLIPWHDLHPDLAANVNNILKAGDLGVRRAAAEVGYPDAHRYDLKNPKFHEFVHERTGNLITVVQDGTLAAVRAGVEKAYTHGWTPQDVANSIKGSIGLNARQATALTNYRASLSTPQKGLSPERINQLSADYEKRLIDQRAIMIGRTEVRQAQNAGQQEVWEQAHSDGLIGSDTEREWNVDGNPCPEICAPMDGETTGLYEPWVLPDGEHVMEPTDSHPNCYCYASLVLK